MDLDRLHEILRETTTAFRKGAPVTVKQVGPLEVTEVFMSPPVPETPPQGMTLHDCHFITVGVFTEKAEARRDEFVALLASYPQPERLAGGPSYIEIGGMIGSQEAAFCLFALGEALGLWNIITPKILRVDGELADQLAGGGMVMCSGYKPSAGTWS